MDVLVQVLLAAAANLVGEAVMGLWRGWRLRHAI